MALSLRSQDEPILDTWVKELVLAGYKPAFSKSRLGMFVEMPEAGPVLYFHWHPRQPRCRVTSNNKGPQYFTTLEEGIEYVNDIIRTA